MHRPAFRRKRVHGDDVRRRFRGVITTDFSKRPLEYGSAPIFAVRTGGVNSKR
jgi:hypothetical protein